MYIDYKIIICDIDSRISLLTGRRNSFLKHSRLSVVAFLNELPITKHDLSSFTVDVSLALVSFRIYVIYYGL